MHQHEVSVNYNSTNPLSTNQISTKKLSALLATLWVGMRAQLLILVAVTANKNLLYNFFVFSIAVEYMPHMPHNQEVVGLKPAKS